MGVGLSTWRNTLHLGVEGIGKAGEFGCTIRRFVMGVPVGGAARCLPRLRASSLQLSP